MKTIKISDSADLRLTQISKSKKRRGEIIKTKQDIVAALIAKLYETEESLGRL